MGGQESGYVRLQDEVVDGLVRENPQRGFLRVWHCVREIAFHV
jgi:hypothetical protein